MGASESKLAFKQSIFLLSGQNDIHPSDEVWKQFYTLPESADDVFALWSPSDLRQLTLSDPESRPSPDIQVEPKKNLETLIYVVTARLRTLQTSHESSDPHQSPTSQVLNCMRILTRLLPYIYEAEHLKNWQQRFFWQPRRPTSVRDRSTTRLGPYFDGLNPSQQYDDLDRDKALGPPLGETLVDIIAKYLFFAGFTIPMRHDATGLPDLDIVVKVWQTGIGSNKSLNCTKENEKNQMETLRLLLTLTSKTLYIPPNAITIANIESVTFLATKLESRSVNGIVCSLLNTVLKYNPNAWSLPIDLTTNSNDPKKLLVTYSIQFLLVLATYNVPPGAGKNQFRQAMSMLHRTDDFQFIQQGSSQMLSQPVSTNFNYFQGREKTLPWASEMLCLIWELLQCNKRFRRYVIETGSALDVLVLVLYYANEAKDDPAKQGILRLCVFIFQTLSVETSFAKRLNTLFAHTETLPSIMRVQNFHGSYGDFLICSIHTIFVSPKGRLESMDQALLAIINNISPFLTGLARATSSKIMELVALLSSPSFLLANESNHNLLRTLLEAVNAILECNHKENPRFVEVLIANRKKFKDLRDFSIDGALFELDRQAQERKDRAEELPSSRNLSRPNSIDSSRGPRQHPSPPPAETPTDSRFEIGEDNDDDDNGEETPTLNSAAQSSSMDSATDLPPSLSEKARGKKPAHASASRNPSTMSIPPANTNVPFSGTFQPSAEWLSSWHPQLPLSRILDTIQRAESRDSHDVSRSAEISRSSRDLDPRLQDLDGKNDSHTKEPTNPSTARTLSTFQWTPVAIGWYAALIWSMVYLQEEEAFHGSGGLYSGTNIVLFRRSATNREISLRRPRGAIDAVGNSLAQRISSISMK